MCHISHIEPCAVTGSCNKQMALPSYLKIVTQTSDSCGKWPMTVPAFSTHCYCISVVRVFMFQNMCKFVIHGSFPCPCTRSIHANKRYFKIDCLPSSFLLCIL